ncbi:MAG TPA: SCO2522 family protein [Phytomonospora sp.]
MTGPPTTTFTESTNEPRIASTSLAHLSIELGHLYMEDYAAGMDRLVSLFAKVRTWAAAAEADAAEALRRVGKTPRISTCFLIDDYFTRFSSPGKVIADVLTAAEANDVRIDYVAREAGCAQAGDVSPASLVEARLVADPPPGTNGHRPPVGVVGWLSNGQRSPSAGSEAMEAPAKWRPPSENAANRHSIFLDVELWDVKGGERTWSCPFLAAVWQLLRLGLLRDNGAVVAAPETCPDLDSGADWTDMPVVMRVDPKAPPFAAYRTFSILDSRFLHIEHAVRTILSQVAVERAVAELVAGRAAGEKLDYPATVVERLEYMFTGPRWTP